MNVTTHGLERSNILLKMGEKTIHLMMDGILGYTCYIWSKDQDMKGEDL